MTTILEFRNAETVLRIEVLQLCSHQLPTIAMQELRVTSNRPADLVMTVGIDPTGVDGEGEYPERPSGKPSGEEPEGLVVWHSNGDVSTCGVAYRSEFLGGDAERSTTRQDELGMQSTSWTFRARAGRAYRVRQMSSIVPAIAQPHPQDHAARLLTLAFNRGWERMREDQRTAWAELWKARSSSTAPTVAGRRSPTRACSTC